MSDSFTPDQIENMNRFFELINSSLSPLSELQRDELAAAAAARQAARDLDLMSDMLKKRLGDSIGSFTRAAFSGQEGLSKYADSVSNASGALGQFAGGLGRFGSVVGGLITAIGSFTASALEQNDNMVKAYESLSQIGSVTSDGLAGVRDRLNDIGLSTAEYEKFINVLKPVSQTLVSFGGSVSNGTDSMINVLSKFTGRDNELELSLRRIGYTTTDIREGVTDYVMLQTRLGKAQGKTTEELTKEAQKYLIQMKGLQELTGLTREDQQRSRDKLLTDARFRLHLSKLEESERNNLLDAVNVYSQVVGDPTGLKDRIVNMGAQTTKAATESVMRNNNEYELILQASKEGPQSFARIMNQIVDNTKKSFEPLSTAAMFAENGLSDMGFSNEIMTNIFEKGQSPLQNHLKTMGVIARVTADRESDLEKTFKIEQDERADRIAADKALAYVGQGLVGVFVALRNIITEFNKMLAESIDWITAHSGFLKPTDLSRPYKKPTKEEIESGRGEGPGRTYGFPRNKIDSSSFDTTAYPTQTPDGTDLSRMSPEDEEAILSRLNFGGRRAERTGGGPVDSQLLELAETIKNRFQGVIFTALNDRYHQTAGNSKSKHLIGKALDFALDHNPTDEEAEKIVKTLKQMGATNAINEYTGGRKNGTGGHFHVEVGGANNGGLFSGSESGFPVMLHGKNESVWPEKDLTDFMKTVQQSTLEQYKQELMTQLVPAKFSDSNGSSIIDAFSAFSEKLDTLISEQRRNNGIQDEILTYTRA